MASLLAAVLEVSSVSRVACTSMARTLVYDLAQLS